MLTRAQKTIIDDVIQQLIRTQTITDELADALSTLCDGSSSGKVLREFFRHQIAPHLSEQQLYHLALQAAKASKKAGYDPLRGETLAAPLYQNYANMLIDPNNVTRDLTFGFGKPFSSEELIRVIETPTMISLHQIAYEYYKGYHEAGNMGLKETAIDSTANLPIFKLCANRLNDPNINNKLLATKFTEQGVAEKNPPPGLASYVFQVKPASTVVRFEPKPLKDLANNAIKAADDRKALGLTSSDKELISEGTFINNPSKEIVQAIGRYDKAIRSGAQKKPEECYQELDTIINLIKEWKTKNAPDKEKTNIADVLLKIMAKESARLLEAMYALQLNTRSATTQLTSDASSKDEKKYDGELDQKAPSFDPAEILKRRERAQKIYEEDSKAEDPLLIAYANQYLIHGHDGENAKNQAAILDKYPRISDIDTIKKHNFFNKLRKPHHVIGDQILHYIGQTCKQHCEKIAAEIMICDDENKFVFGVKMLYRLGEDKKKLAIQAVMPFVLDSNKLPKDKQEEEAEKIIKDEKLIRKAYLYRAEQSLRAHPLP